MLNSSGILLQNYVSRSLKITRRFNSLKNAKFFNLFDKCLSETPKKLLYVKNINLNRGFATSLIQLQTDQNKEAPPVVKEVLTKKMVREKVAERGYFDTHAFINTLLQNGFTQQQSEIICHLFKDVVNYIAEDIKKECVTRPGQVSYVIK